VLLFISSVVFYKHVYVIALHMINYAKIINYVYSIHMYFKPLDNVQTNIVMLTVGDVFPNCFIVRWKM